MKNFTPEMIEKAKEAKTAEELLALAKENNVEMTEEEAKTYVEQLSPASGELADDDLDNVAGGGCGGGSSSPAPASPEPEKRLYHGTFYEGSLVVGPLCGSLMSMMNGSISNTTRACRACVKNTIHFNNEWDWEISCPVCGQHFHFAENPKKLGFRLAED